MYIASDKEQLSIDEFFMPFGGKLLKSNRWVKLAAMMPWDEIERIYLKSFDSDRGRPAIPSRIAFGAIFIKEYDSLTDAGTVSAIAENPYMPIVIGDPAYRGKGIGRKVISALIEHGKSLGYDHLAVGEIYDWNVGSRRCFESVGFVAYEKSEKGSSYRLSL